MFTYLVAFCESCAIKENTLNFTKKDHSLSPIDGPGFHLLICSKSKLPRVKILEETMKQETMNGVP